MPSSSLFPFKVSALQIIIQYMPYFNWENPQKSHIANPLLNNHTNFQCSIKTTADNINISGLGNQMFYLATEETGEKLVAFSLSEDHTKTQPYRYICRIGMSF